MVVGCALAQVWYVLYMLTYTYVLLFKYKSSESFSHAEAFLFTPAY